MVKGRYDRLDDFTRGQVVGLATAGWKPTAIAKTVRKPNGRKVTKQSVSRTIHKFKRLGGVNASASRGRPRALTPNQKKALTKLVFKERGQAVVSISYCQRKIPALRKVSRWTVARALQDAGLAWLRRRAKRWVAPVYRGPRLSYARWLKKQPRAEFRKFAFQDGTAFYLARGPQDAEEKKRLKLGQFVWRMANGKDGLWNDNVGPSLYAHAQGTPVKIWGCLANGVFSYWVLPECRKTENGKKRKGTTHMNMDRYQKMMRSQGRKWLRASYGRRVPKCVWLIQDHEKCLWNEVSVSTAAKQGFTVLTKFPKCSPDLNVIEWFWARLKQLLGKNAPVKFEKRGAFLARLRRTVRSMNKNMHEELLKQCLNQHARADEVKELKGGKTSF
jgi:hypothetical protein